MGRLTKQRTEHQQQKAGVIQREYQYDPFGNLSVFKDGISKENSWEVRYAYDMVDRLKRTEGDLNENFIFDPAGNLLAQQKKESGKTTRGNRLLAQGDRKFEYDARGNLIRETRGKGGKLETLFEYNLNNQLYKVSKDNQTTEYSYDAIGRRIRKQDNFGTTQYLWAGDQLAQEQRNNIQKTYVYEPESFKPIAMVQDGEIYHYHLDHLGTPRELSNQQGKIIWKARYKTYGKIAAKDVEEVENNLRFQGQYFDEETGLHYNRHRYYDPSSGQFTTQDPIGLLGGVNNYQYAPNPTGWVDPLGLSCKENTWNEFQKDHTGIFSNTKDAASAYKELKTSSAPSPWPYGYDPASNIREMKVGETFRMVVDDNKEDTPGRFATCDAVLDAQYGRQQLAIKEAWKPTLDNVVTYKVKKPFLVYEGPVGPQIDGGKYLPGGGTQITFVDKADWAQARPNTYNNYTDSPLLEVESIRKLS